MHCYGHQDHEAIGICKTCQKAVCATCAKDTGRGIACSDVCVKEISEVNQIIDRSKQIYSIGTGSNSKLPATGIMFNLFFAAVFGGFGLFPLTQNRNVEWFLLIMGIGFFLFGVMGYIRTRKLQINC